MPPTPRAAPGQAACLAPHGAVAQCQSRLLPRLQILGDELKSIAAALQSDPTKVLYLGKDANEKIVKGLDLSRFRIVAFATHGLIPGDLDGLTQPALALTAPEVADIDGDGLLTVEEILSLKLNADGSCCQLEIRRRAGAGGGSGPGMGSGFLCRQQRPAGHQLVVDSASAREIVTGVFRPPGQNPKLSRAESLRQSMVALMESSEFKNKEGKTVYTHATPCSGRPHHHRGDGGSCRARRGRRLTPQAAPPARRSP